MRISRQTHAAAESIWALGPLSATNPNCSLREKERLSANGYQQLRGALQMARFGTDDWFLLHWMAEAAQCLAQHFADGDGPLYFFSGEVQPLTLDPDDRRFFVRRCGAPYFLF